MNPELNAITIDNGSGHVCGITSVLITSSHTEQYTLLSPSEKDDASLVTFTSPSVCSASGSPSEYESPHTLQV